MCEYAIVNDSEMPICEYTKTLCTLCVLGNGNTYNEAVKATEKGGAE